MTDAEYEVQKARVQRYFDKWTTMLGFSWWEHVEIAYWREPLTPLPGEDVYHPSAQPLADCQARWKYLTATIRFCVLDLEQYDDARVEYLVVHELCHALINEMREEDPDGSHEERVVTQLAQAMRRVYDHAETYQDDEATPPKATRRKPAPK